MNNIVRYFLHAVEEFPQSPALIQNGNSITYTDLSDAIRRTVKLYEEKGIGPGDQVLIAAPFSIELYRHVLALFYIGAVPVFIDQWAGFVRLRRSLSYVNCKAIIAAAPVQLLRFFSSALRKIKIRIPPQAIAEQTSNKGIFDNPADSPALITFTTGTTGYPKAAIRTHENLEAQFLALKPLLNQQFKTCLCTLPIVILINLALGRTTVLPARNFKIKDPGSIAQLIQDISVHQVESLICSPSVLKYFMQANRNSFKSIKEVISGGDCIFPDMAKSLVDFFDAQQMTVVFGGTEAEPISHIPVRELTEIDAKTVLEKGLAVGKVAEICDIHIIPFSQKPIKIHQTEDWERLQLPKGTIGEIIVSGQHVVKSYAGIPDDTNEHKIIYQHRVWHRTGDLGMLDNQGNLFYFGRGLQRFQMQDKTYYPILLEYFLRQQSLLSGLALVVKDKQVFVVVEAADSPDREKLDRTISADLNMLGLPKAKLITVKEIPRDKRHQSKIDYEQLKKQIR